MPLENKHFGDWDEIKYINYGLMLYETFTDELCVMGPFFFLIPEPFLRRLFNLFINIAATPALLHPSPRLQLSLNEETERILIELVNGNVPFLKMECFMKNCIPQKHSNNPTTVSPPCYPREPHDFIHIFWCLNALVLRPSNTQVESRSFELFIILKM